jgi:hypothetical protein
MRWKRHAVGCLLRTSQGFADFSELLTSFTSDTTSSTLTTCHIRLHYSHGI